MPFSTRRLVVLPLALAALLVAGCATTQSATQQQTDSSSEDDDLKPYGEVISPAAESDSGLFTVHRVEDKLFYEIPDSLLDEDLLLISRLAQVPEGLGAYLNAGRKAAERVVRFERERANRVLLRPVSFASIANDSLPIARSVRANTFEPILARFDIETVPADSDAVVIEVTDLFTKDVPALTGFLGRQEVRSRYGIRGLDTERSLIDYARSFPRNVETRHTLTYKATKGPGESTGAMSLQFNQSLVALPDDPMQQRRCDRRVGYFDVERTNYGSDALKADEECLISRWRLVPEDMDAYRRGELVAPKEPIVFYLDPAVPERWRPYFKKGIEDWNRAFRAAGFKNAIQAKDAPVDDSTFSPEDVRFSTVRYVASETRNAMGPSVVDPRSGEIIESDILWYHNHIRSYRNRLMIETGAANPEARTLDLPEALIGETMRQVIAHEVGHAIGLPHNMVASSAFPVDSLRSPGFTERYGVAPSIMDYARQNYIAQPGDGVERFIRKIGPYDLYAVEWGYRRFPDRSPEAREEKLNSMIRAHADDPVYRYLSRSNAAADPRAQTEDLGDDPVEAGRMAVNNLKRVVPNLTAWATTRGEDYDDLAQIYGELLGMWRRYMGHATDVVGGVYATPTSSRQDAPIYTPVPRDRQERALRFLSEYVFEPPAWLLNEDVLSRIDGTGAVNRMRSLQAGVLRNLIQPDRLQRLVEAEARWPEQAYPLAAMLEDVKQDVWSELGSEEPQIGLYRRNLQRAYLGRAEKLLASEKLQSTEIRPALRGQLRTLRAETREAATRTDDAPTRNHLRDATDRIEAILSPDDENEA